MQKVLIIQIARFGDLIQTKRLILSLAAKYETQLCVDRSVADLARILFPDIIIHAVNVHAKLDYRLQRENESVFKEIGKTDFEYIYNCNFSPFTYAICRLFDNESVLGYRPVDHSCGGFIRSPLARLVFRIGKIRNLASLNLVDYWAYMTDKPIAGNLVNPLAQGGGRGIGIVLSGREARRSLPGDVLGKISELVFRQLGGPELVIFGTREQLRQSRDLQRSFSRAMQEKCRDLTGRTDWSQLIAEMTGLDLLLCPDTGSMHLAAHLGVPVMAFFLSSALAHETGPYGMGHKIWQASLDCSPCLESGPCVKKNACLEPFRNPAFLRCISLSLRGGDASLPEGLQYWQTDFDDLGLVLKLSGGKDPWSQQRNITRDILKNCVNIPVSYKSLQEIPEQKAKTIFNELVPESEWMLPPGRYD